MKRGKPARPNFSRDKKDFKKSDRSSSRFSKNDGAASKRKFERGDKRTSDFKRDDKRSSRFDRKESSDRGTRFKREERKDSYSDKKPRFKSNDERPSRFDRKESSDRGTRFNREDRKDSYSDRKPRFKSDDERPTRIDRKESSDRKPRFNKEDDRSTGFDKRSRFKSDEERPSRYDNDRKSASSRGFKDDRKKRKDSKEPVKFKKEGAGNFDIFKKKKFVKPKRDKEFESRGKSRFRDEKQDYRERGSRDFDSRERDFNAPLAVGLTRLNKYIANSGICSRREADSLITSGVITINGKTITELGYKVNHGDVVRMNGEPIKPERMAYVLLNKPKDYITTLDDPEGRRTVLQLLGNICSQRVYPVGRLDRNTTGLLLLTNDGELTQQLTHPKFGARKIYQVSLDKNLRQEDFDKIVEGFELEDGPIKVDSITYVQDAGSKKEIGIEIHSGRNRIVRRIFEHLGYDVVKLDRVFFAGLTKKDLPKGRCRLLSDKEISFLKMTPKAKDLRVVK
ncbi:MAG: pseudouridine synthase [Bacteroidetes bacterium]|nr:pseudouridine synthase [Bacteroidota bacterium]